VQLTNKYDENKTKIIYFIFSFADCGKNDQYFIKNNYEKACQSFKVRYHNFIENVTASGG